jgi:hypothetical protein
MESILNKQNSLLETRQGVFDEQVIQVVAIDL